MRKQDACKDLEEFCEHCSNVIVGNDFHLDEFAYGILCGDCYEALSEEADRPKSRRDA